MKQKNALKYVFYKETNHPKFENPFFILYNFKMKTNLSIIDCYRGLNLIVRCTGINSYCYTDQEINKYHISNEQKAIKTKNLNVINSYYSFKIKQ